MRAVTKSKYYMDAATAEDITLFGFLIKDRIEPEILGSCLKLKQAVLLILDLNHTLVAFANLMVHHWPHSECHLDPFSTDTCHHRIAVERVHLGRNI